jgi:transcriptional regulator with XRE-family HTH domain
MDQKKTGAFLQSLRKERELTQEELAEKFSVTSRTVSRWETGVSQSYRYNTAIHA